MSEADDLLVSIGLTEKKYLATVARLEARTQKAAKGMEQSFERSNRSFVRGAQRANTSANAFANGGLRQMGMQLSQVAQQGAVTGDYLRALSVQAADIGLAFGTAGIAIGALISVLGPMAINLLTGAENADQLEESLKALAAVSDDLRGSNELLSSDLDTLVEKYGNASLRVREFALAQAEIKVADARKALAEQSDALTSLTQAYMTSSEEGRRYENTLSRIQEQFGVTRDEATVMKDIFRDMFTAADFGSQQAALEEFVSLIRSAGVNAEDLPDGFREAFSAMIDVSNATDEASAAADALETTMETVSSTTGTVAEGMNAATGAIGASADEAARLAENLGISAALAVRIAAMGPQGMPTQSGDGKQYGGRGGDPRQFGGGINDWQNREAIVFLENWTPPKAAKAGSKRKRSGSSGQSEAEKERASALREVERYVDKTRSAVEEYHAELEELAALKPFFEQTGQAEAYARAVAMVNEEFRKSQNEEFIKAIEDVSDAMARVIVDGENLGEAMRGVFQQIARDLIASGIRELLMSTFGFGSKKSGGFLGKVFGGLLSFDGGGFTGVGARSGGVDGKGGFPAILHPNETVLDHTKAQASGGSVGITVGVDGQGNIVPLIRRVSGQVSVQVTGSAMQAQRQSFAGQIQATEARGTSK